MRREGLRRHHRRTKAWLPSWIWLRRTIPGAMLRRTLRQIQRMKILDLTNMPIPKMHHLNLMPLLLPLLLLEMMLLHLQEVIPILVITHRQDLTRLRVRGHSRRWIHAWLRIILSRVSARELLLMLLGQMLLMLQRQLLQLEWMHLLVRGHSRRWVHA